MDLTDGHPAVEGDNSPFMGALNRLSQLIDKDDVQHMIDVQVATLDRLECTNRCLVNCSNMAQNKLAATTKLYKRTAKQLAESKKDLDVCYKKILDLKSRLKAEHPELLSSEKNNEASPSEAEVDDE